MGRTSPPFLHDARVYLSTLSVNTAPASTVFTNSTVTNAPLVVRTQDEAIAATIELHDLPAPDNANTPADGGCPVPVNNIARANGSPIFYIHTEDTPDTLSVTFVRRMIQTCHVGTVVKPVKLCCVTGASRRRSSRH